MFYPILPIATQPIPLAPVPTHLGVLSEQRFPSEARQPKPSTQFVQQIPIPAPTLRSIAAPMTALNSASPHAFSPALPQSLLRSSPTILPSTLPTALKFSYPLSTVVPMTSPFGWRNHPIHGEQRFHSGIDLGAPHGSPVLASASGKVKFAGSKGGYGLTVMVEHGEGSVETLYGHLSEILVASGTWVEAGQIIGKVGSTGLSTGPHLHFEIRQLDRGEWVAMNPASFVSGTPSFTAQRNPFQHEEAFLRQVTR
jgi:murein DD-endopeptidase MepM/ murein hydrolase activator NlpD